MSDSASGGTPAPGESGGGQSDAVPQGIFAVAPPPGALGGGREEAWVAAQADPRCEWPPGVVAGLLSAGLRCTAEERDARPPLGEAEQMLARLLPSTPLEPEAGAAAPPRDRLAREAALECGICCERLRDTVFLPCNHAWACRACAEELLDGPCPLCRTLVEALSAHSGPVLRTYQGS